MLQLLQHLDADCWIWSNIQFQQESQRLEYVPFIIASTSNEIQYFSGVPFVARRDRIVPGFAFPIIDIRTIGFVGDSVDDRSQLRINRSIDRSIIVHQSVLEEEQTRDWLNGQTLQVVWGVWNFVQNRTNRRIVFGATTK